MDWNNFFTLRKRIDDANQNPKTVLFEGIQEKIIEEIRKAEIDIKIAVTWFTNNEIFDELLKKLEGDEVGVQLAVLNDRINNKLEGNDFQKFIQLGGEFYFTEVTELVHHKFCIIDSSTVITGSYNWTYYAEKRNWENVVILNAKSIVDQFTQEFKAILDKHKKVINLDDEFLYMSSVDGNNYLTWDYKYQVEDMLAKNMKIEAGQLLYSIIKDGEADTNLKNQKKELLKELNNDKKMAVTPFEIGMTFKSGYSMVIPAFKTIPISVERLGYTADDDQEAVSTDIIKFDRFKDKQLTITLSPIKKSLKGTKKVKYTFNLNEDGWLTIKAEELNGYNVFVEKTVNIKKWI